MVGECEGTALNGDFGVMLSGVRRTDLADQAFRQHAYEQWAEHRGLLAVRGDDLAGLTPEELVSWSANFGRVETDRLAARETRMVGEHPILRIGNTVDEQGNPNATFANVPILESDADVQYNPETRRPVWHTDSTFKANPPIGSVFHCRQAPPRGGETLFADTRGAYEALGDSEKAALASLEAVCSLAHHDKKISLYTPGYPTLTPEQRAANPPNRVPVVLEHPVTGKPALYGLNSSTCMLVEKGTPVPQEDLDRFDLEGAEDDSVLALRDLLPHITSPPFTVRWRWQSGDIVVWDNRCTMHSASGFEFERYTREMWRLTLLA